MIKVKDLVLLAILVVCFTLSKGWKHVLTNDGQGVVLYGSLSALRTALQNGSRVRVGCDNYFTKVNSVTMGKHASAQSLDHVSVASSGKFQDNAYWWFTMLRTDGTRQMARYNVGSNVGRGYSTDRVQMHWYVDDNWELALHHSNNGQAIEGSIEKLLDAIKLGAEVRLLTKSSSGSAMFHTFDAQNLSIKNGKVCGMTTDHVSKSVKGELVEIQQNAYWFFTIYCTDGNLDMSRWTMGAHVDRGHTQAKAEVQWFVKY